MTSQDKSTRTNRIEAGIDQVTDPGGAKYRGADDGVGPDALEAEQRREAGASESGPGVPVVTGAQSKGLVIGALVGGAIGLVMLLPFAFIPISGLALGGRLIVAALAGAFAGGTAGAMYLGGRLPELEGETVDADGRPSVGTTLRDPNSDARGR